MKKFYFLAIVFDGMTLGDAFDVFVPKNVPSSFLLETYLKPYIHVGIYGYSMTNADHIHTCHTCSAS